MAFGGVQRLGSALRTGGISARRNFSSDRARFKAFRVQAAANRVTKFEAQVASRKAERERILLEAKAIKKRGGGKVSLKIGAPGPIRIKIKRMEGQLEKARGERSLLQRQIGGSDGDRKVLLQAEFISVDDRVETLRQQLREADAQLDAAERLAGPATERKAPPRRKKPALKKVVKKPVKKPLKLVKLKTKTLVKRTPKRQPTSVSTSLSKRR